MPQSLLVTQCLQNDFVQLIDAFDPLPNSLHVGYQESQRLLGMVVEDGPVMTVMHWAYRVPEVDLALVHIRDWHRRDDASQTQHLAMFGEHCVADTDGARFVFENAIVPERKADVVNASGLNDFVETPLAEILDRLVAGGLRRVGVMGVWTEAKVFFLCYELATRYPQLELGLCSALCASASRQMHFISLDQLASILGVRVFPSVGDFSAFLAGSLPAPPALRSARLDPARLHFSGGYRCSDDDERLLLYLFRDCREVELKGLDGGFSGNVVLKARAVDRMGHQQVPCVVKIGPRSLIARERSSFERIQEVLGNTAPAVVDFAETGERGAIKYRYAAMLEGAVHCLQELYEGGASEEQISGWLERVFGQQLGKLYAAATQEKVNLWRHYEFSGRWADSIAARIASILDCSQADAMQRQIIPGVCGSDIVSFYKNDCDKLAASDADLHWMSYVHGDLNGRNILVDEQGNVWIIDFFNCDRSHVLRDLVKLENDLLFIWTKLADENELRQACSLFDQLAAQSDLGLPPDPAQAERFAAPQLQRAWRTACRLRAWYPALLGLDRGPGQLHVALLRYAAHTLSFDECSSLQKHLALHACARLVQLIRADTQHKRRLLVSVLQGGQPQNAGHVGITLLPGRRDRGRRLESDLADLRDAGMGAVLCLLSPDEFERYGVPDLLERYQAAGLQVRHLPVLDQGVPDMPRLLYALDWMSALLEAGTNVLVHCVGGLGRSGLVAAAYLIRHRGMNPDEAIARVRADRSPRAIESRAQEAFVRSFPQAIARKGMAK